MNDFDNIIFEDEVSQSEVFGEQYKEYLKADDVSTFNASLIKDISDILNNIISELPGLTEFHKDSLIKIFEAFNIVRRNIDPKRLKPFNYFLNEDEEFLLYRNSKQGLTNIIIDSEECITYSFISKGSDEDKLKFFKEDKEGKIDFEGLAYYFFSH